MRTYFTSESVTEGHPDKVCDKIADSILDAYLAQDPMSRCACEVCATKGFVLIMGEITSTAVVDVEKIARKVIADIGYTADWSKGFNADDVEICVKLGTQSPDISQGVTNSQESRDGAGDDFDKIGAGDQGMMFGYACSETDELMPLPIFLAHALTAKLTEVRKNGTLPYLRPDGKAQVTVAYEKDCPVAVTAVVLSTQHDEAIDQKQLAEDIKKYVIAPVIPEKLLQEATYHINPTGKFVVGGPEGDSGLTGRKIIVDTYGGYCTHGGGSFSGKDPTKVDRSAAYYARYCAKNIVAAGLAERCRVSLAYAIGTATPLEVAIDTYGTGILDDYALSVLCTKIFDFRPAAIIANLGLRYCKYSDFTNYGHMGHPDANWEKTDKADELKLAAIECRN